MSAKPLGCKKRAILVSWSRQRVDHSTLAPPESLRNKLMFWVSQACFWKLTHDVIPLNQTTTYSHAFFYLWVWLVNSGPDVSNILTPPPPNKDATLVDFLLREQIYEVINLCREKLILLSLYWSLVDGSHCLWTCGSTLWWESIGSEAAHLTVSHKERQRKEPLPTHATSDIRSPTRFHILKVPPPPNSTKLWTKLWHADIWQTFQIQNTAGRNSNRHISILIVHLIDIFNSKRHQDIYLEVVRQPQ